MTSICTHVPACGNWSPQHGQSGRSQVLSDVATAQEQTEKTCLCCTVLPYAT